MSLIAKASTGTKREPIPAGVKTAVCCGIIDLGEQETKWQDQTKLSDKVMFVWELPTETIETEDGPVPRTVSKQYTNSLHERAGLRKMLQSWRGKPLTDEEVAGFNLGNMLGKGCLLSIVHTTGKDGNTYANVDTIVGLPDGVTAPKATHLMSFDFDDKDVLDRLDMLPEWIQNRIKAGNTYSRLLAKEEAPWQPDTGDATDDELPF